MYHNVIFRDTGNIDRSASEDAVYILFVGNSHVFYGNVPEQLSEILNTYGIEIRYKDISVNGATLNDLKDNAAFEMQSKNYDYVVFQDQTRRPVNYANQFFCGNFI